MLTKSQREQRLLTDRRQSLFPSSPQISTSKSKIAQGQTIETRYCLQQIEDASRN
jgi:hypothetical protein